MILDALICNDPQILNVLIILKTIMKIITIVVPVILILFVTIDIMKTIASQEVDTKKLFKIASKRFIAAVIVFLVPAIIGLALSIIPDGKFAYKDCYDMAGDYSKTVSKTNEIIGSMEVEIKTCTNKSNECYNTLTNNYKQAKQWIKLIPKKQGNINREETISNYQKRLEAIKTKIDSIK